MDPQLNPYAPPTSSVDPGAAPSPDLEYVLASRGARFFGAFIDGIFMTLLMVPTFFLVDWARLDPTDLVEVYKVLGIPMLIYAGIQWPLIATSGQSIGKKLLGTKIVMLDGSPCGFVNGVILRGWILGAAGQIPVIGRFISLVDALFIFGEEQRCLHDLIASTRVVVAPVQG